MISSLAAGSARRPCRAPLRGSRSPRARAPRKLRVVPLAGSSESDNPVSSPMPIPPSQRRRAAPTSANPASRVSGADLMYGAQALQDWLHSACSAAQRRQKCARAASSTAVSGASTSRNTIPWSRARVPRAARYRSGNPGRARRIRRRPRARPRARATFLRAREASRNGNAAPRASSRPRSSHAFHGSTSGLFHTARPARSLLVGKGDAYGCRTLCARHDERPATDQVS